MCMLSVAVKCQFVTFTAPSAVSARLGLATAHMTRQSPQCMQRQIVAPGAEHKLGSTPWRSKSLATLHAHPM